MIIVLLALLGLAWGSFVNALVPRLKAKKPIVNDRSVCDHCGHVLAPADLIPLLSWLWLKGKCRYCKKPVSWTNPAIELAMSVLFVASYLQWPVEIIYAADIFEFAIWLAFLVGLVALFVYDVQWMILPNVIVYPLICGALLVTFIESVFLGGGPLIVRDAVLGLVVFGGFFYLLFIISRGRWIGGGDVKLGMFLGIYLGLGRAVVGLALSFYIAALIVIPLLLLGKVKRKQAVPFGPFIIVAGIIAQLFGYQIIDWYLGFVLG